ncbi:MAG: hypothetical protein RR791_05205 [Lachnospiraceae bacterium]
MKVIIEAETKGFRTEIEKIKNQTKSATTSIKSETSKIKNTFSGLKKSLAALAIGASLIKIGKDSASMAMAVEASVQQINRLMGASSETFKKWAKNNALAFNMSQSDALKFGSVYSNLLTSFMDNTDDVMNGTTELLKASAIVASGTGRTMEDVMERIRSGMLGNTEAIEDLGVDVRVGMLESTDAFKRFAGDASWDQLDVKTQQQIRLFGILEQTSQKFGTSVLSNTNSSLQQLVAILKDVALNIGNAFLPILNIVIPILSGFAMKLREVTSYISTFMSLLFGKSPKTSAVASASQQTSNALGGAANSANDLSSGLGTAASNAKKTAKEMASLAGFDDLNILSSSSGSDSGSGDSGDTGGISSGGFDWGDDTGTAITEIDTSGIQKTVDKVKKLFGDMKKMIVENRVPIISALAGILAGFIAFQGFKGFGGITSSISSLLSHMNNLAKVIGVGPAGWQALATSIAGIAAPALAVVAIVTAVTTALVYLYQTSSSFRSIVNEAFNSLFEILSNAYNNILLPLFSLLADLFNTIFVPISAFLVDVFVTAVDLVSSTVLSFWNNVIAPLANFLLTQFAIILQGVIDVWNAWKPSIDLIMDVLGNVWDSVLKPFVDFIKNTFIAIFEMFGDVIDELIPHVQEMFQGLVDFFVGIFTLDIDKCWKGICEIFSGAWNLIQDVFSPVTDFFDGIWKGIQGSFSNVTEWFKNVFSTAWTAVKNVFNAGSEIFSGIVNGIAGVFSGVVNTLIDGINSVIADPFNSINGVLNTVRLIDIPLIGQPFKGLWGKNPLSVPQIPHFATGAVVNKATLGVFGESGTEAIVPLERNTGWIKKVANQFSEVTEGPTGSTGPYIIYLVLEDGTVLAKKVINDIKDYQRRTGDPVFNY